MKALATCNSEGWTKMNTVDELMTLDKPIVMGPRHHPVPHATALEQFEASLQHAGYAYKNQTGLLSPDGMRYIYVTEVMPNIEDALNVFDDMAFCVGFLNYNNKQKAFTGIYGEHVFVCSNQCFQYGGEVTRRHIGNIEEVLNDKIDAIIGNIDTYFGKRTNEIKILQNTAVTDEMLGGLVRDMVDSNVYPNNFIVNTIKEFNHPTFTYNTDGGTTWDLLQAGTHVVKNYKNPLRRNDIAMNYNNQIKMFVPEQV